MENIRIMLVDNDVQVEKMIDFLEMKGSDIVVSASDPLDIQRVFLTRSPNVIVAKEKREKNTALLKHLTKGQLTPQIYLLADEFDLSPRTDFSEYPNVFLIEHSEFRAIFNMIRLNAFDEYRTKLAEMLIRDIEKYRTNIKKEVVE